MYDAVVDFMTKLETYKIIRTSMKEQLNSQDFEQNGNEINEPQNNNLEENGLEKNGSEVKGQCESLQSPALEKTNEEDNLMEESNTDEGADALSEEEYVNYAEMTEGQLVEAAKELMKSNPESYASLKKRMDAIKHAFYKSIKSRNEEQLQKHLDEGGKREDFVATVNPLEEEIREILQNYKTKRDAELLRGENEKQENLNAKNRILEEMKALLDNTEEDAIAKWPKFKKLRDEWKEIGQVPAANVNALWKSFQLYSENFYDNLKIGNELRDYDFRKNLELKTNLCEQAEGLADVKDVIAGFRKLQQLHDEWKKIGPVSKEIREEIWTRFKNASTVVNKRHHDYFDQLRSEEVENLAKKESLCEKMESLDLTSFNSYKDWQDQTEVVLGFQAEWKTIGFAPKKDNNLIFERFRTACDNFFKAKNTFLKNTKETMVSNLNRKLALCEKAESLKDSSDWKATSEVLVELQKEWKTIGAVPKKQSDVVWKRFSGACDAFFNRKNAEFSGQHKEQEDNLSKKKELIDKINALTINGDAEEKYNELKTLISEWNAVGHVPFKEKDKLYKKYKEAIDKKFDDLKAENANKRFEAFKANVQDKSPKERQSTVSNERRRMVKSYEGIMNDIKTIETNMCFFRNSKNGSAIVEEYQQKVENLKKESQQILAQIKQLDEATASDVKDCKNADKEK